MVVWEVLGWVGSGLQGSRRQNIEREFSFCFFRESGLKAVWGVRPVGLHKESSPKFNTAPGLKEATFPYILQSFQTYFS